MTSHSFVKIRPILFFSHSIKYCEFPHVITILRTQIMSLPGPSYLLDYDAVRVTVRVLKLIKLASINCPLLYWSLCVLDSWFAAAEMNKILAPMEILTNQLSRLFTSCFAERMHWETSWPRFVIFTRKLGLQNIELLDWKTYFYYHVYFVFSIRGVLVFFQCGIWLFSYIQ